MECDKDMPDADAVEEERMMYGHGALTQEELDEKIDDHHIYPHRPHNIHKTLPFHQLFISLFNPLNEQRRKPGAVVARKKVGPHGKLNPTPQDAKNQIIDRFISRWRAQCGNDIYPAFRLIVPEKDRDRAMYGLKEKTIGKLLVKVIGIDKNSEDAYNLINWKLPGAGVRSAATAGDFGARCFEVLQKRPILTRPGVMSVAEVNAKLDLLASASKENDQMLLFEDFYRQMNPDELMWLIRIMLRQMKIGATEKSFFDRWHPDAESLFNVSSSLRRVCWELYDPDVRLDSDGTSVTLMQCFQPQLANFQSKTFERMVESMNPTEEDDEFWIEEKLDGERMQLHMVEDAATPGGRRFNFWSRKGKDYTYLYGSGFEDDNSSLTRHLKEAFDPSVKSIILDGEMITWDMEEDGIVGFGTLKTAALSEARNPYQGTGHRPFFKVFDCLYLNDRPLTQYTMRNRRQALEAAVKPVHRRMEIHEYQVAHKASEIEGLLRKVVEQASEGLVLKNPRSSYRLSERNDDWWKVKPEYMTEFGEALDCVIIGGYYGSGHRGGSLSSFLCGLRLGEDLLAAEKRRGNKVDEQHCWSFFKVGGGMAAADYKEIREATEGKWKEFNPKKPPSDFISLAGGERMHERPDMWIKPSDSLVVEVKAASVSQTDQFKMGLTLRFPRFKRLRRDKSWREALSVSEFISLKHDAEQSRDDKTLEIDNDRKKRRAAVSGVGAGRMKKKPLVVMGADDGTMAMNAYAGPESKLFSGMQFFIITGSEKPFQKTKGELEQLVKANGGSIVQSQSAGENVLCVSDKNVVKVQSIRKKGGQNVIRPTWLYDCIEQASLDAELEMERFLLPFEERHMLVTRAEDEEMIRRATDEFGDSYCRDVGVEELRSLFREMEMPIRKKDMTSTDEMLEQFEERRVDLGKGRGSMFRGVVAYLHDGKDDNVKADVDMDPGDGGAASRIEQEDLELVFARQKLMFGGARIVRDLNDASITHVLVGDDKTRIHELRQEMARRFKLPRMVKADWVMECWKEKTVLDEEKFAP